jgi:hypothetical protein
MQQVVRGKNSTLNFRRPALMTLLSREPNGTYARSVNCVVCRTGNDKARVFATT